MLTKIVKYGSVAGLLLASMSWHSGTNYQIVLDLFVYMGAIVMVQQAVRAQEYAWAASLTGIMLLLNPIVPAFTPAGNLMLLLFLVGLSPFLITFAALMDATVTLHPNVIIEPPPQRTLPIPTSAWAVV
jgi:hypothetical protein